VQEKWFRTGVVAEQIGISQYRIRELAKQGLIQSRRSTNGMLYISSAELERLKTNGPPAMPARAPVTDDPPEAPEENEAPVRRMSSPLPPARNSLTEELYAEPSRKLARQKERVIGLGMTVQMQELQRQIREGERAERDDRDRRAKERQDSESRRNWLDYAIARIPETCDLHAVVHEKVEALLNRMDPQRPDLRKMVDAIVDQALRPIRHREAQGRAVAETVKSKLRLMARKTELENWACCEAARAVVELGEHADFSTMCHAAGAVVDRANAIYDHQSKIETETNALWWASLPRGARIEERAEAQELARSALKALPPGTPDPKFKATVQGAIAPVLARIAERNAQDELRRLESQHKMRIDLAVSYLSLPLAATSEDMDKARRQVRAALEQHPATTPDKEMERARVAILAPIIAAIHAREAGRRNAEAAQLQQITAERRADSAMSHVWPYLIALEKDKQIFFDDGLDKFRTEGAFKKVIRPDLVKLLHENPDLTDAELKEEIAELIDEFWGDVVD
jgi:hypothetical protein